ncbi:hypothetical protein PX554_19510 [Sphingomonas sp. H39-1-10]|uniref:hypothetical protein n=1 Tax=Sphingomonas pollutisoli TaxID=3030829 RepID=UPI0023B904EA|nr:hypothetical protein [Sphingomonas pollutisoli]MDF0490318.1 hypothetical protein [Sphingomonas pollutisoli]
MRDQAAAVAMPGRTRAGGGGHAGQHLEVAFPEPAMLAKDKGKLRIRSFHGTGVPPEKK